MFSEHRRERDFSHVGRLKPEEAEGNPSLRPLGFDADEKNNEEKQKHEPKKRIGIAQYPLMTYPDGAHIGAGRDSSPENLLVGEQFTPTIPRTVDGNDSGGKKDNRCGERALVEKTEPLPQREMLREASGGYRCVHSPEDISPSRPGRA